MLLSGLQKGDLTKSENWWGTTLMSVVAKVMGEEYQNVLM